MLCIAAHRPGRSPGQRYRFEQYLPDLRAAGIEAELSFLLDEARDRTLYSPGNYAGKARIAMHSRKIRKQDLARLRTFDAVLIYREALLTRTTFFEQAVHQAGVPMIFDFDDAIWIRDMHRSNRWLSGLKDPDKIRRLLPLASHVTAGNDYLAKFARGFNKRVTVIPSTVDTDLIHPVDHAPSEIPVIGWMGSQTTLAHLETVYPALTELHRRLNSKVRFEFVGAEAQAPPPPNTTFLPWTADSENERLNGFDLGLMPLPHTDWAEGKCGMKLLLYMAAGLPVVASPVGVNASMVEGHGFLANTTQEWVEALTTLLQDPSQSQSLGNAGRRFVESSFSRKHWVPEVVDIYRSAVYKTAGRR